MPLSLRKGKNFLPGSSTILPQLRGSVSGFLLCHIHTGIVSLRWTCGTGLNPTWTTLRSVQAGSAATPPASGPVLQAVRTPAGGHFTLPRALHTPHPPVVTPLLSLPPHTHTHTLVIQEIDLKAGGGFKTTVGAMCRMMLIKLDWFGTMLPRISVSVSKTLQQKLTAASQPDRYVLIH